VWAIVLRMAEKWNIPPWQIVPEKSILYWFAHWQFFEAKRAEAKEKPEWQS
jgi:hypothetical protein